MKKRYYIAYGSNLSVQQMKWRCPDAKVAGIATLNNWKLAFRTHATIEPCEGREVPVLVWEISEADERNLDLYEGYPKYYIKKEMRITMMTDISGEHSKSIKAMVYIMTDKHIRRIPSQGYIDVIEEGYERFGFDKAELELAIKEAKDSCKKI